ncbi:MAG: hypothetical protein R3F46_00055 [bacterium]
MSSARSIILLICLALLAGSCSAGSGSPLPDPEIGDAMHYVRPEAEAGQTGLPALPAPSSIARSSSDVSDSNRVLHGGSVSANLLSHNTSGAVYEPQYTEQSVGVGDAAWNGYDFHGLKDYAGDARIRLYWLFGPSASGNEYLALANFQTDRWDWLHVVDGEVNPGDAAPYISPDGHLYATMLLLGSETCTLHWLVLGEDVTPYVFLISDLDFDKYLNIAPRTVSFDATNAEGYGSEIVSWDFDFEGDGSWDVLGNTDGLAIHQYPAGNYTAVVRVTSAGGKQGTGQRSFAIIDPNNQPPKALITADALSGTAPLHSGLDALACSDPDGFITTYEWDFNNDGEWDLVTDSPEQVHTDLVAWGANLVTLRVTDNYYAVDTDTLIINLSQGWLYSYVDQNVGLNSDVSMCVTGEGAMARPCVAYADYLTKDIRYCRAADAGGTMWGTIRYPLTKPHQAYSLHGVNVVYSGVVDAPIIGCVTENTNFTSSLRSVTANDELGNSWKQDLKFAEEVDPKYFCSLAIINNIPVMVSAAGNNSSGFGQGSLIMVRATDASASAWGTPKQLLGGESNVGYWDVELLPSFNGSEFVPLLSYVHADNSGYHASSMRAIDGLGNSWELPDRVHDGAIYDCSMAMVDGRPALAAGSSSQHGSMFFGRSGDMKGQTWPDSEQFAEGGSPQLAIWGGLPVIAYFSFAEQGLYITVASDAQGSAWQAPLLVDNRYEHGRYSDLLVHNEQLMICYAGADDSLICASWQ